MRTIGYSLSILFVPAFVGALVWLMPSRAAVIRRVAASTVEVNADLGGDDLALGSGTIIGSSDGYVFVLTCHHVIDQAIGITVHRKGGSEIPAFIDSDDEEHDLTVLYARLKAPVLSVSGHWPLVYDSVYLVGAPDNEEGTASEGLLTDLQYPIGGHFFWRVTNALIMKGLSGGTAVNVAGELVGVVARVSHNTSQQGVLIPLWTIRAFARDYMVSQ